VEVEKIVEGSKERNESLFQLSSACIVAGSKREVAAKRHPFAENFRTSSGRRACPLLSQKV
jgi:hypothetical protein